MSEENKTGELVVAEATTTPSIANQFDIVDVESAKAFMDNYYLLGFGKERVNDLGDIFMM